MHRYKSKCGRAIIAGAVASVLLAALAFSAFTYARPLIFSWLGDNGSSTIAFQRGTIINRSVTQHGLTLHLEQGYADASRTALTMQVISSDRHGTTRPTFGKVYLLDEQNHQYAAITSIQVQGDALIEFLPLPSAELNTRQSLTLVVPMLSGPGSSSGTLAAPWQISFQIQPQSGRSMAFSQAPETHNGITIQPERLDVGPSGMRLLVRLSGLDPDTSLFSLTHFATQENDTRGCPPGGGYCVSTGGTSDGALVQLQEPDRPRLVPTWVAIQDQATQGVNYLPRADQVVGSQGSATVAFLFFTPLHTTSGTIHLAIDRVQLAAVHADPSLPERIVTGPWEFDLSSR